MYPLISQAQGMLQERYALPDGESAFALMQRASQRYDVKLRTLAGFLVTAAPRPDGREQLWFPRRVRRPEPALTYTSAHRSGSGSRGAVLKAVLSHTLAVTGTDMGNVQLTDRARGGLRIEEHTGLTPGFVDFFAHVGDDGTACARAARDVAQVTVRDVASDPMFSEPARLAILAAGSRACQSVPPTPRPDCASAWSRPTWTGPSRDCRRPRPRPSTPRGRPSGPMARLARPHGRPGRPGVPARPRPRRPGVGVRRS
ncbi:ANTAR domain-containing protein [Streptomyces sp. DG1A-41]|uniref:ANTAR domain-containing protein n=1 Tax=Streptomyces sp. DG1A-41 TaxID=3125779 RepID=UPI0030D03793